MITTFDTITPHIESDCFVADNATVIGRVELGRQSSVWFNAVLRGDVERIRIGARSNIQDGAVLHTDPGSPLNVGSDVTIGHMAMLHGCTIGEGSLIGIGSIVLNGARIGSGCLVGAGALVPEGKVIPDRSLVIGTPGKVVRTLSDAEIEELRSSAAHYVANSEKYLQLRGCGGTGSDQPEDGIRSPG